jgi:hypothetical protein
MHISNGIKVTLGTKPAAGYLRNQGVSMEDAMHISNGIKDKARGIKVTLGTKPAAGYLRNQGVSMEDAMRVLRVWSSSRGDRRVWGRGFVKGVVHVDLGEVIDAARKVA